jgi:hypothetical protein
MADEEQTINFEVQVPPDLEVGVYSNVLSVWNSPHDFTLDFGVTMNPRTDENGVVTVPCRVVARVKIPITVASDVLRAISQQVGQFEEAAGPIWKPGDNSPTFPPEDMR